MQFKEFLKKNSWKSQMEHSRLKFEKSVFWRSCSIASKPRITLSMAKSACVYGREQRKI